MSSTANAKLSNGEPARTVVNASDGLDDLCSKKHIRFYNWIIVTFRRFGAIYVQGIYGSIDQIRIEVFDNSILILIFSGGLAEWWSSSKTALSSDFVKNVDRRSSIDSFKTLYIQA